MGHDAAARFPELSGLPRALAPHRLILDGEVVAFGDDGRPSFGLLQHRMHLSRPAEIARVAPRIPVYYVVFDLLCSTIETSPGVPIWSAASC